MKQNRLLEDPVRSVFLSYLVPSVSATLVTSIYILADTMMIAQRLYDRPRHRFCGNCGS